jgi:CBS domain containing-hemolysin-like protein
MQRLPGGKLELPGTAQLDDIEHTLEVEFDVDKSQVTTIAGFLMAKLGRVPNAGDVWMMDDYRVVTINTEGPRVVTVRIEPRVTNPGPSSPTPAPATEPVR